MILEHNKGSNVFEPDLINMVLKVLHMEVTKERLRFLQILTEVKSWDVVKELDSNFELDFDIATRNTFSSLA